MLTRGQDKTRRNINCTGVLVLVSRVYCVTWNVNGRVPPFSLDPLLKEYGIKGEDDSPPDVLAIG